MMTSSNGNIFRVTGPLCGEFTGPGEFPTQRPVTRSFDVFFDLRLNKRLSKQPWGWWFETPSWSLWRQRNVDTLVKNNTSIYAGHLWRITSTFRCAWPFFYLPRSTYRPIAQIPERTSLISHNAPFCNRNMHMCTTKLCIVGYLPDALWDLWDGSILNQWDVTLSHRYIELLLSLAETLLSHI